LDDDPEEPQEDGQSDEPQKDVQREVDQKHDDKEKNALEVRKVYFRLG